MQNLNKKVTELMKANGFEDVQDIMDYSDDQWIVYVENGYTALVSADGDDLVLDSIERSQEQEEAHRAQEEATLDPTWVVPYVVYNPEPIYYNGDLVANVRRVDNDIYGNPMYWVIIEDGSSLCNQLYDYVMTPKSPPSGVTRRKKSSRIAVIQSYNIVEDLTRLLEYAYGFNAKEVLDKMDRIWINESKTIKLDCPACHDGIYKENGKSYRCPVCQGKGEISHYISASHDGYLKPLTDQEKCEIEKQFGEKW